MASAPKIPRIITGQNLYDSNDDYQGLIDKQTPPDVNFTTVDIPYGGGTKQIPKRLEAMRATFIFREVNKNIFGVSPKTMLVLQSKGYLENPEASGKLDVVYKGNIDKRKFYDLDDSTDIVNAQVEMAVSYFKYVLDNDVLVEIDLENQICKFNGTDIWTERRNAL